MGAYVGESGDHELMEVLDFYKCYGPRSWEGGKLRLDDPYPGEKKKPSKGAGIFNLARRYAQSFNDHHFCF
jgi:hypothetical protein